MIALGVLVIGGGLVCAASIVAAVWLFRTPPADVVEAPPAVPPPVPLGGTPEADVADPMEPLGPRPEGEPFGVGRQWRGSVRCDDQPQPAPARLRVVSRAGETFNGQVTVTRPTQRLEWRVEGHYDPTTRAVRLEHAGWEHQPRGAAETRIDATLDPSEQRLDGRTDMPSCPTIVLMRR